MSTAPTPERLHRVAMVTVHTSPLAQPGSGDAGGMNVYVLEVARQLARRGMAVDLFTRTTGASQAAVVEVLKSIYDPEIPVDIYELGLIYNVEVSEDGDATITMTLTTPHCPVAESLPQEVELRAMSVPGIRDAEVKLVWDPLWDPSKMSDEARLELGML